MPALLAASRLQDTLKQARKTGVMNWEPERLHGYAKPKQGQETPQPT